MKLLDIDDRETDENKIDSSYRNMSVEELQARLQEIRKKILGSFVLLCSAFIAVVALGLAWFVSNNKVSGAGNSISAKNDGIEIGSKGEKSVHDDLLQKIMKNIITYNLPNDNKHDTSRGASINWLLNSDSNMKNYAAISDGQSNLDGRTGSGGQATEEIDINVKEREGYAIEPGTKGHLDFYVKSNTAGKITLDFELDINAYKVTNLGDMDGENQKYQMEEVESTDEVNMMKGHILYFITSKITEGTEDAGPFRWIKDEDGRLKFSIVINNAKKDIEYEYSIYWVWPLNLATILLNEGDPLLNGQNIEFDGMKDEGNKSIRSAVIADMQEKPEKYFYSYLTHLPLTGNAAEVTYINTIHQNSGTDNSYNRQKYVDLSSYYNQADMKIGEGISFITVTLRYLSKTEGTEANE